MGFCRIYVTVEGSPSVALRQETLSNEVNIYRLHLPINVQCFSSAWIQLDKKEQWPTT